MKNWKEISIRKESSIVNAMELLNKMGSQFVIVVDENDKLVGTVTDGDIRRGLLKGVKIENSVEDVLNPLPKTLPIGTSRKKIATFMNDHEFAYVPIVNEVNEVVEVVSYQDITHIEQKDNHVIIMAGGLGSRLASLTHDRPKPMLEIGGKPILETIINSFKDHGFHKFILSVNYKSEVIEEYFKDGSALGVEINYIKEKSRSGTAGALSLYQSNDLPFIVMNGDLLTKIDFSDLLAAHVDQKNAATVCLRQYEYQIPFGVVVTEHNKVIRLEEKPVRRHWVNGGIYVISPTMLGLAPKDTYYDMTTFLADIMETGQQVGAFPFYEYWLDIGRLDDYERAHTEFLEIFK